MFDKLEKLPDDPILGLLRLFREDDSDSKVDLGAGVYQNEHGATEVLSSVKKAEKRLWDTQLTKTYEGLKGNLEFNAAMTRMMFGDDHPALADGRVATIQTTGGSGGLHIAAAVLLRATPGVRVWASEPTWPNHQPLLASAGLEMCSYPYYNGDHHQVDFSAMLAGLEKASPGEVVLLHGCCHNPTGADLKHAQWDELIELLAARQLVPFIDVAYQGFADGLDNDAYGVRACAARLPEVLVVSSCSKNFGLYRDRVGCTSIVARDADTANIGASHLANVTRRVYSMPPAHGAEVVQIILNDDELHREWRAELSAMRNRINALRRSFAAMLNEKCGTNQFDFIAQQRGMFSLLGLDRAQIQRLRDEYHVYMVGSSRANIAGVSEANLDYLTDAIVAVL